MNSGELVRLMLGRMRKTKTLAELAQESAHQLRILTGFDRVMVYRFHPDGSGEVIAELNHRVRNILSLVRGLVAQGKDTASNIEEFTAVLGGRIQALARAHDQITNLNWAPVALKALVESEAGAYLGSRADRIQMEGPDVALDPKAFATLALVSMR